MVRRTSWVILLAVVCAPSPVAAQILDRIEIVSTRSTAEIHILFTTAVVYKSHFPAKHGDLVRVDLVLPQLDKSVGLRREILTSPPSNLVPAFRVAFPDLSSNRIKSLTIKFRKPVEFTVKTARNRTSIVIVVPLKTPKLLPPTASRSREAPAASGSAEPPLQAKKERKKERLKPSRTEQSTRGRTNQVLGPIDVVRAKSFAEIHIPFKTPVRYLYHVSSRRGDFVRIWLMMLKVDRSRVLKREVAASPPNDLVPKFTATFPERKGTRARSLALKFAEPVKVSVRSAKNERGIIVTVRLKERQPDQVRKPSRDKSPTPSQKDVQKAADNLMAKGRAALSAGENEKATQIFNALLTLPPNQHSQEAQELVGVARERSKEIEKAKVEYELYLKLYPEGEGAARVRQRLAALKRTKPPKLARGSSEKPRPRSPRETSVFGNLSQYYFWGRTQSESNAIIGGFATSINDSLVDQSLLVSNLNLTGRSRSTRYDNRVVLRGTNNWDTVAQAEREIEFRLRRAYARHEDKERRYMVQIGRQFGSFGGILNPYDGGWLRYGVLPQLRLNVVAGLPHETSADSEFRLDFGRYFLGGDVSFGPAAGNWSGDAYFISQMADGIVDRRATGVELRYSSNTISGISHIDYDVSYRELNIAMFNGTLQTEAGTTFTALADYRKTPSLQTTNGLLATGTNSVSEALRTVNEEELRRQAKALTADSLLLQLGVNYPFTARWQLGSDLSLTRITGTDAAGIQPAIEGTGNILSYTARALGRNILIRNHTLSIRATYIDSPNFDGQSLLLNSLARFGDTWQLDTSVTVYHQLDDNDVRLIRVTPSVRLAYRWRNNLTFEVQAGVERADTNGLNQQDATLRQFFFVGYVWEQ